MEKGCSPPHPGGLWSFSADLLEALWFEFSLLVAKFDLSAKIEIFELAKKWGNPQKLPGRKWKTCCA